MKPRRRVLYKLCADRDHHGVYSRHAVALSLKGAHRLARTMGPDVCVLRVKKSGSVNVTNGMLGRPGPDIPVRPGRHLYTFPEVHVRTAMAGRLCIVGDDVSHHRDRGDGGPAFT